MKRLEIYEKESGRKLPINILELYNSHPHCVSCPYGCSVWRCELFLQHLILMASNYFSFRFQFSTVIVIVPVSSSKQRN